MKRQGAAPDGTVAERIDAAFDVLTRAERQLANAITENYPVSGLGSISALAGASGVSMPTVVRMARKLGFAGFPDLQAALRSELEATISSPIAKHDRWTAAAPDEHILNRFADQLMDNLRQTLRHLDPGQFDAVAGLLADAERHVYAVGGRITQSLADYFFTHMQVIRPNVTLLTSNANTWPHDVVNMKAGDVLVIFDIRRYERSVLRLAELTRSRGVEIVLFTDQWGSPVERHAGHAFRCRIEAPSAWDSSVVTMVLIEALIAAVETGTWEETRARMKTLEELFDQTRLFSKFV